MFVRELLANIADGESVRPFCGCKVLLSATAVETAPPGVRVYRPGSIDGDLSAATNRGSVQPVSR